MDNKQAAVTFLQLVVDGKIDEAYQNYATVGGVHHNTFTPAGFPALQKGMKDADVKFPNKRFSIKHVLKEGDLVAVHSHLVLQPNTPGFITIHMFRFEKDRIVELWDASQPIPPDSVNKDGAF